MLKARVGIDGDVNSAEILVQILKIARASYHGGIVGGV